MCELEDCRLAAVCISHTGGPPNVCIVITESTCILYPVYRYAAFKGMRTLDFHL